MVTQVELPLPSGKPLPSTTTYSTLLWTLAPFVRCTLPLRLEGVRNIPRTGSLILAANHLSHVDPIYLILAARRQLYFLAKDEHFRTPIVKHVMAMSGQIQTERETGAMDALGRACDVLSSGRALGIFPEGTRSRKAKGPFLQSGKTGVARLAARYPTTPVFPVALIGTREVMTPAVHRIPRIWNGVRIRVGKPIHWADNHGNLQQSRAKRTDLRAFTDTLLGKISQLGAP